MDYIYEGTIKDKAQKERPLAIRPLTAEDLNEILHVQEKVLAHLKDKDTLQPLSEEEFRLILEGNGMMIGAFTDDELIAFRALLIPTIDEEHLGRDIGLPEEELPKVIYQEVSNVLPEFRGNQLQKTLAILIMQELNKQHHEFRYVCCTVAPFNIPSLKDKLAQRMEIVALKEKYRGSLRYIFAKDLKAVEDPSWLEVTAIRMDDIEAQQAKLEQGWRGFQMEERDGTMWVYYGVTGTSGSFNINRR